MDVAEGLESEKQEADDLCVYPSSCKTLRATV